MPSDRDLPDPDPMAIARRFLGVQAPDLLPWGDGLINRTWRVRVGPGDYLLQRINPVVFPDPAAIMANLARLLAAWTQDPVAGLRLPRAIPDPTGATLLRDDDGGPWRLLEFIAPSRTLERLDGPAQGQEVGRMLGAFHQLGARLPVDALAVTLPGFHDTPRYLAALDASRDQAGDDARVAAALAFVDARRALVTVLRDAGLPVRVTHGDPKLDNLLFTPDGTRAISLIDLDTVQPGLIHHDLADCLRSCCNARGESGGGAIRFDVALARAILDGYAAATPGLLDDYELGLLYPAIRLLPLELGMRFLTDHLLGDRWFRVSARGQNLDKAQIQFALVADIEANEAVLRQGIRDAFGR